MSFVHLHVHTQYSILDGASRIRSIYSKENKEKKREKKLLSIGLIDKAKELQMPAIAITDHGNMFGALEFYTEAKAKGIIPIIGCEVYVAPKSRFDRKTEGSEEKSALHLVLLAKNKEGYDNLKMLVSLGYTEGFYYKPRIDHELIEKYNKGIIALSACIGGEIPQRIRLNDIVGAKAVANYYKSIFRNDFYIELQDQGVENQRSTNKELFKIAKELELPLVVTNDVHYVEKNDARAHETLLAVQTKTTLSNQRRFRFPSDEFYLKSEEEMRECFPKMNKAFQNTLKIAEECKELDITTKEYFMPQYPLKEGETNATTLKRMCSEGLEKRYNGNIPLEAKERLEMELGVIEKMGFEGYFLIVSDFINHARSIGIVVGPGRGSAAGSIVAYATGITEVNPLDYNLLFERFLNPDRQSMPDIDVDFQDDRRDEVIQYVKDKYGENNVSQIATFSALHGRSVIRDVCRAMDIELSTADRIAKMLPNNVSLYDAYEDITEFRNVIDSSKIFKDMYETSIKLEGLVRSVGLHAAGVVISDRPITDCVPIYQDSKTGTRACQYEMEYIEKAGLIKIDFLGIKNLRLIKDAIADIKKHHGIEIDLEHISMKDDKIFDVFRKGNTSGIFQFESDGMRKLLMDIGPTDFSDLVSAVALYRPGPLNAGMGKQYADRKNKREDVNYMHPDLKPVLQETLGVLIYQEQIMGISRVLGGFTPGKADELRKAMGKKKIDIMNKMEADFIEGGIKKRYDKKMLTEIYKMMKGFGEYGFNKSHSVCYALIAYHEGYIKAYYPLEFYVALFNTCIDDTEKISIYMNELREKGIEMIAPSVNESSALFSQKDGKIVYAFNAIKGVGIQAAEEIEREREKNGEFKSIEDFAQRVKIQLVNKKVYEALIKSGAFSSFGLSTQALMDSLESIMQHAGSFQRESAAGQNMLFDSAVNIEAAALSIINKAEYDSQTLKQNELETLGFSMLHHPFAKYLGKIDYKNYNTLSDIDKAVSGDTLIIPCIISAVRDITTKAGKDMTVMDVSDNNTDKSFFLRESDLKKFDTILHADNAVIIEIRLSMSTKGDGRMFTNMQKIYSLESVIKGKQKVFSKKQNTDTKNENEMNEQAYKVENFVSKTNLDKNKYVSIHLLENSVDDMDLLCLKDAIKKYPGNYPVVVNVVNEEKTQRYDLGDKFCVNACQAFFDSTHEGIRSLLKIGLHSS